MDEGFYYARWKPEVELGDETTIIQVVEGQLVRVFGSNIGYPTDWFVIGPRVKMGVEGGSASTKTDA